MSKRRYRKKQVNKAETLSNEKGIISRNPGMFKKQNNKPTGFSD